MSVENRKKETKASTSAFKVASTPQGKGVSEPPPKSKRTISEVSDASAEELTIIHQQLEHLNTDLKQTKEKVMSLMSKEDVQNFISETIGKVALSLEKHLETVVDKKVQEKTNELTEKMKSLEFDNKQLTDRVTKAEKDLKTYKDKFAACEKLAIAAAQKSNFNEQYSRKNNVKILNIPETTHETEQTLTEVIVTELLSKGNVDLDPQDIVAIHRIPGKTGAPKPVLMKLKNNSVKTRIMKQRRSMKDAGHRLVDDVTKLNTGLIGRLTKHSRIESAWYFNGAVYGKTTGGQRHKFEVYCNINSVIDQTTDQADGEEAMEEEAIYEA